MNMLYDCTCISSVILERDEIATLDLSSYETGKII